MDDVDRGLRGPSLGHDASAGAAPPGGCTGIGGRQGQSALVRRGGSVGASPAGWPDTMAVLHICGDACGDAWGCVQPHGVQVITGRTVQVKVASPAAPAESVAMTRTVYCPLVVGVPEMSPVEPMDRPGGSPVAL